MKFKFAMFAAVAALSLTACSSAPKPVAGLPEATNPPQQFCFFESTPNSDVEFVNVRKVKLKKGVYGSVNQVIPRVKPYVETLGGNAIINFQAKQRFSIWPWRFMTPVAWGKAIRIIDSKGQSCEEMGGRLEESFYGEN
ncbi:MAG: hypothetical protein HUK19_08165 [Fibrobacter sp.]|nr:hypothetical protein [Fibrobacter sp.]